MAGVNDWAALRRLGSFLLVNHAFLGTKRTLTIDGGHWLAVLLIQGAIIGVWG